MTCPSVFEITVTSTEHCEWQGFVFFPSSGMRFPFQSVLELICIIEEKAFLQSSPDLTVLDGQPNL